MTFCCIFYHLRTLAGCQSVAAAALCEGAVSAREISKYFYGGAYILSESDCVDYTKTGRVVVDTTRSAYEGNIYVGLRAEPGLLHRFLSQCLRR